MDDERIARPTLGAGKICYLEIPAEDVEASARFYATVFGWRIRRRGDGATAFDDGVGEVSGAWVTGRPPMSEAGLLVYVMVEDADATVAKVEAAGGRVVAPVDRSGEVVARVLDPAGNLVGVYEQPGLADASAAADPAEEAVR